MALNTVEELIADIRAGKMIILMDDEDRENEGDLVMAATHVRPEDINFMITHARGLVCLTLSCDRCAQLDLPLMVNKSGAAHGTNFTLSIEASEGVTTGISAADRARTIQAAVSPLAKPSDIVQPGHIFPLMAQAGGVLHRAGHTEAGCDLARLAGLEPAAAIVEIMNEDGSMARRADLEVFAQKHDLKIGTIADLIHYRILNEQTVELESVQSLYTAYGEFSLYRYSEYGSHDTHIALVKNPKNVDLSQQVPVVRVHGFSPMRDLFQQQIAGQPNWNLNAVLQQLASSDVGVLVWIAGETSLDLGEALSQLSIEKPLKQSESTPYRSIGVGAQILRSLGVRKMRLLSSPLKFNGLSGFDLEIVEYISPTQS